MVDLSTVVAAYLAGLFIWAGGTKLRDRRSFRRGLRDLGVGPRSLILSLVWAVPLAEVSGAVAVMIPPLRGVGALTLALLLIAFSVVVWHNLRRGNLVPCNCFGSKDDTPLSRLTLWRNVGLLVAVALLLIARPAVFNLSDLALSAVLGGALLLLQGVVLAAAENTRIVWRATRTSAL